MKTKEIKQGEEFIAAGFVFTYDVDGSKVKFKLVRRYDKAQKSKIAPPTEEQVKLYAAENGYDSNFMWEKMKAYIDNDMKDSHDKEIKNWKMKLNQVWFQPQYKLKEQPKPKNDLIL